MKVIRETVGDAEIFIEVLGEDVDVIGERPRTGRKTDQTGIEDKVKNAYTQMKKMLAEVASDVGGQLSQIPDPVRPKEVSVEFAIGLSAEVGPIWVLSGKGEYAYKVTITWKSE